MQTVKFEQIDSIGNPIKYQIALKQLTNYSICSRKLRGRRMQPKIFGNFLIKY